jgi:hypothetical protein
MEAEMWGAVHAKRDISVVQMGFVKGIFQQETPCEKVPCLDPSSNGKVMSG